MTSSTFLCPFFFFFFFLIFSKLAAFSEEDAFTFNGFKSANLSLDGISSITPDGLLQLTNTTKQVMGHAFYPAPLHFFRSPTGKSTLSSFSTTFVFGIIGEYIELNGHGITFLIARTTNFSTATPNQYLGLFNPTDNGNSSNHILAIEFDTIQNPEFQDIDNNHVGIDINGLKSVNSHTAGYYTGGGFNNLSLGSRQPMQVWIDFNGEDKQLNVTLSPIKMSKPSQPLLSSTIDSIIIPNSAAAADAYIGFSSATGSYSTSHYLLGWSFKMNGEPEPLDYDQLPKLPRVDTRRKSRHLAIWLSTASCFFLVFVVAATLLMRRTRYAEILEDWEKQYGPHRFSYKELLRATDAFKDQGLLGVGGFGRVYRGVLPASNIEVAVKRVSHESKQGMKEFVAEIVSIGQIRHRNVVQLLGYCRLKGELLLVYRFVPNGSLDKFLYDGNNQVVLSWHHRFRIIKGVASGLSYLHEEWEQVVVHRDIKASNVLLDSEMNGRLGDFGLARLYDHGTDPRATHIVGTLGYLAPELARCGKATTVTDVFAFGVFLLEVACGRRPLGEQFVLLDWVEENWKNGSLIATADRRLGEEYSPEEMEMVLKLGLLCSNRVPTARPSMRQVVQILDGNMLLPPEFSPACMSFGILSSRENKEFNDYIMSFPSSVATASSISISDGR